MANNSADEKPLETGAFVVQATRGVIRDQPMRRKMMVVVLVLALLLLIAGSTFLSSAVNPREHLIFGLAYWIACVWLTITALLLALFDLAAVRRQGRQERRELQQKYSDALESRERLRRNLTTDDQK